MKALPDLFPETLLVTVANGHTSTTSLKVAEHFQKTHKNVLRAIEQLQADYTEMGLSKLNFELTSYKVKQSKPRPMYLMDRKAFSMLAMGFTGKKALVWRDDFYNAFEAMEAALRTRIDQEAEAFRQVRPYVAPVVEDARLGLPRTATAKRLGKSVGAVSYHRRVARGFAMLPGAKGPHQPA